jgi:hypothetical protein
VIASTVLRTNAPRVHLVRGGEVGVSPGAVALVTGGEGGERERRDTEDRVAHLDRTTEQPARAGVDDEVAAVARPLDARADGAAGAEPAEDAPTGDRPALPAA